MRCEIVAPFGSACNLDAIDRGALYYVHVTGTSARVCSGLAVEASLSLTSDVCLATTYHAGKQTVRCTGICAVRLFTSGDTARLDQEGPAGTAQASARASRETQLNGRRQPRHGE